MNESAGTDAARIVSWRKVAWSYASRPIHASIVIGEQRHYIAYLLAKHLVKHGEIPVLCWAQAKVSRYRDSGANDWLQAKLRAYHQYREAGLSQEKRTSEMHPAKYPINFGEYGSNIGFVRNLGNIIPTRAGQTSRVRSGLLRQPTEMRYSGGEVMS